MTPLALPGPYRELVSSMSRSARPSLTTPDGLIEALQQLNAARRAAAGPPARGAPSTLEDTVEAMFQASHHLAVYGSLGPGQVNHRIIAALSGRWRDGWVRGRLLPAGWGTELGFPGLRWEPAGEQVSVKLFTSPALEDHWNRLDRFEGSEYRRILVPVYRQATILAVANIYEARSGANA